MKKNKDINEVLDEFAHTIAKDAEHAEALDEKVDAFKALTAYAALRHKMNQKGDALEEDGEPTMDELRKALTGEGKNGRARVRDH